MTVSKIVALSCAVAGLCGSVNAAVVSHWTVNAAFPTGAGLVPTGTSYSIGAADIGALTAGSELKSVHALPAATYTSPAGNGSTWSFSSNNWSIGDYYEARFSTVGFTGITISWDQARSSTGPVTFDLIISTDGGSNFSTLIDNYTVLQSGGGGSPGTWSTSTFNALYRTSGVAAGLAAENNSLVIVRFVSQVAGAATGSNRIDNVMIEGIPTPGAMALLGLGGLLAARRRR